MFSKATENNSLFFIQKVTGASLFCCLKTTPKLPSLGKYAIIMLTFFSKRYKDQPKLSWELPRRIVENDCI